MAAVLVRLFPIRQSFNATGDLLHSFLMENASRISQPKMCPSKDFKSNPPR